MKAAQMQRYAKDVHLTIREVDDPIPTQTEVVIRIMAAAVNPVDLLIGTGRLRLIQSYRMPLTLGNECAGIVVRTGNSVHELKPGDHVYARLPKHAVGAFAEFVAVEADAVAKMPEGLSFAEAAAVPLTGLTAYQAITEELEARPGETLLIPGGSGSFGQMAVPIARALGLRVIVTGNGRARERFLAMGAERYIDYREENYWDVLDPVDHVIDTLGTGEIEHELSVLKKGGRLVSLKAGPNSMFADRNGISGIKRALFSLAGRRLDAIARKQEKEYRFLFVRADGEQLRAVTGIVERAGMRPALDSHAFNLEQVNDALELVGKGPLEGKVVVQPDGPMR